MVLEAIFTVLVELIITPIVDCVVSSVKPHLCYAFKCDSQVQNLQEATEKLIEEKDEVENSVAEATRSGKEISKKVTTWMNKVEKAIGEAEQIIQGKDEAKKKCCSGSCPNLKTRYQLSKKADKQASVIGKLVQEANELNQIAFCPTLDPIVEPGVFDQEALASRVEILGRIMDALKDPNLSMIGVYGMGGVGKTKLAQEVQAKAMQEKMFENVVLVAVSPTPELRRIQSEIADFLGLKFDAEELPGRASQLYKRLERSKVLIILDDIWHRLDLNAVGIPSGDSCKDCKLLLTSRRRDVLRYEMGAQKEFSMDVLGEGDAWKLFQTIAPKSIDPQFQATATEVSKKCSGLPLLIIIVAKDLQNKELFEWVDMLKQLSVIGNEDIYEKVHKVLEKSFDKLPGEEVKSLFLLCSMFSQSNIQVQMLLIYSMGLGIFKQRATIQDARIRLLTLINKLKTDCLLLDGDKDGFVKMHDVVRDTAISIASRLQHAFVGAGQIGSSDWPSQNCTKISLPYCDVRELPGDLECPQADLFLLFTEDLCLEIPNSFFQGLRTLKVVDFTGMRSGPSLPSSLGLLPNLHTLSLQRCRLNSVDIIGQLKQLQLLSLSGSKIAELPREIEELTQLKLLDLSNCNMLQVIPASVLSKLCLLEELHMLNSFDRWDTLGNASIMELEGLSHLSTLEVQIENPKLIPRGFRFFDGLQLDNFKISIGRKLNWYGKYEKSKKIILKLESGVQLGQRIEGLLRGAEDISLDGAWGINFDVEYFPRLKHLLIQNDSGNIQHLIKFKGRASFQMLESLDLKSLKSLEKICDGQLVTGSFGKLQKLNVSNCHKLKSLFPISSAKCMPQLQELELDSCDSVEAVVCDGTEDASHQDNKVIEFSQLNSLKFNNLPELGCFCKKEVGTAQVKLLFNEMISFPNLKSLEVHKCKNLNYIFTASMVKCLGQLKTLEIEECESVEEIMLIGKSEEIEEESIDKTVFPKLDSLYLRNLPNSRRFCCGHLIEFPSLKTLTIKECPAMKNFVSKFSSNRNTNGSDRYFFNELVTLSNLETMEASGMGSYRYLWDEKFIVGDSFCKLASLTINKCSKLQVIFPSNAYRRFQSLENLTVHYCDDVKEIYQYEGVNFQGENNVPTFALRKLDISNLQSLKHIWSKDSYRACTFQSLQSVSIIYCEDNLEYIFPESIACDLVQLQQLYIGRCSVEMIIAKKSKGCPASFVFPELTSIELSCLDKMRTICEGPHALELPKLKSLKLFDCDNLRVQESMPSMEKFIPNLEELTIDDQGFNAIHESGVFSAELFSNLKKVTVHSIDQSIHFLSSFLKQLNSVETLVLEWCFNDWESLFDDENAVGEKEHHSRLKHLQLRHLGRLKHIVKKESPLNSILQHLQTLAVRWCEGLMDIAPSSTSFHNLTTLNISYCSKMTKLVTSSTAKTMVQLVHMRVECCYAIEEIIAADANCTKHDDVINFSKLKCLELVNLYKIDSFCSGHCTFKFPLLEKVTVNSCGKMKSFCAGKLRTPKLRGIIFNDEQQWEGDLNATVACQIREWVGVRFEEWKLFQNVNSVELVKDAFSSKVISANQMQFLHRLKKIIVKDCELVQVVFGLEGLCVEDGHVGMLPKLNELRLANLPSFNKLCSKPPAGVLDFNKLTVLEIDNCGSLEYAFTWSMASCLVHLQTIELRNCERIERMIKGEEVDCAVTVVFCSLTKIVLECLTKFSSFYSGNGDLEWPSLEKISIRECPSIQAFISRLPREEGNGKEFIPNLEELTIDDQGFNAIHESGVSPAEFFSNLKKVRVKSIDQESIQFLSGFLKRLNSVETLVFEDGSLDWETLFDDEKAVGEKEHHSRLKHFELRDLQGLKHIVEKESPLNSILQHLQTLVVSSCYDLMDIASSSTSFHNLTTLNISYCSKMTKLVTSSTAKTMVQLEHMRVYHCNAMEEIIATDANCTKHDVINFNKLKFLELDDLYNINSFCSGHCKFNFPLLERVTVKSCPKMKNFFGGELSTPKWQGIVFDDEKQWEGDLNATIARQLRQWAGVRFEEWKFPQSVESVKVVKDSFSSRVISANQMQFLHRLKEIVVKDCELVQVVFDLEGLCVKDGHVGMLPKLKKLQLVNLTRLSKLCSKPPAGVLEFNKLTELEIDNCGGLEYAFTWSMAACLVQLRTIKLSNCEEMETIMKGEEADDALLVVLGSLKTVILEYLPKFSSFYTGIGDLDCPSLKNINIKGCPSMQAFVSRLVRGEGEKVQNSHSCHKVFPCLNELSLDINSIVVILQVQLPTNFFLKVKKLVLLCCSVKTAESCVHLFHFLSRLPSIDKLEIKTSSLEELFKFERLNILEEAMTLPHITSLNLQDVADVKHIWWCASLLQSLRTLEVGKCGDLIDLAPSSTSFQNLTALKVYGCNQLTNLMTSSVAKSMARLVKLSVEHCDMLKEMVENDNDGTVDVVFTKMKTMELFYLPSLQSFSSGCCTFQFPCLENVVLKRCPNLKTFCAGTIIAQNLYDVKHGHAFERRCYWEGDINATIQQLYMNMVGFENMEDVKLSIFPLLKEKWCDQIPFKYFCKLKKLVVDDIALISYAISPHLLRQLEQLKELKVEKCEAVEQVYDLEGLNAYEWGSKRLKELRLIDLPRLRQVWSKDPQRILSFRNLELLEVQNCGKLTYIFDLSMALRLPRLEHVQVKNCNSIEHIIVKAEEEMVQEFQTIFPSLQSISLQHLTSLSSFYSTTGLLQCPSLKTIEVVECPNMELFPSTFSNGQDSCMDFEERDEQISSKDTNSTPTILGNQISIPELEELKVEWDSLERIFNDNNQSEILSRLKLIELIGFPGEYGSLPPNFLRLLPKLEKLSLSDPLIEEINLHELSSLEGEYHESLTLFTKLKFSKLPKLKQLVCDDFRQVAIFQKLEDLQVVECSSLKILVPPLVSFQNLTNLQVSNCNGMNNLISTSTARSLVQLKKMEVKKCKMMEEIIAVGSDGVDHEIRFSQLECLKLVELPCLESFCSGKIDSKFPSLEEVVVIGCPNMKKFASSVTPKLKKVKTGRRKYEWEWEGNLDKTIQALHVKKEAEEIEPRSM